MHTKLILTTLFSLVIIYLLCLTVYKMNGNDLVFPSPNTILAEFFSLFAVWKTYSLILSTLFRLVVTLLLSLFLGVLFGMLSAIFRIVEIFLKPYITILRSMPVVVLLLVLMMFFGTNSTPFWITSLVLFPIFYEATLKGVKEIDRDLMDVWKLESNMNLGVVKKIMLPLSFPYISQAITSGIGLGFKVLIMGEYMVSARNSIGNVIINSANNLEYQKVYAWCIILVVLVLFVELLPRLIEKVYFQIKENKFA